MQAPSLHHANVARANSGLLLTHLVKCKLLRYEPSPWEQQWLDRADAIANLDAQCATMKEAGDLVDEWLTGVAKCKQDAAACWAALPDRVFSKFVRECKLVGLRAMRRSMVVEEQVEPLVGHMRHPQALRACVPPGQHPVDIQDRNYLCLLGDDPAAVRARHPGRAILVDAGTSQFGTSLGYLIKAYTALGIYFDAVYAWEARPLNATSYWAGVPADVRPRLHFYNAPITAEPGSAMNPIEWIKKIHQAGDYTVLKLDVDNDDLEDKLVQQVLDLENAGDIISEMFFEKHYSSAEMKEYFGTPKSTYPGALRLMHELRSNGVRAHYWP